MLRQQFLGTLDLQISIPLLTNYDACIEANHDQKWKIIKHQDDLLLMELESLLSSNECKELLDHLHRETFENMSEKYVTEQRNNSRLIAVDKKLADLLWQRLSFDNQFKEFVQDTRPLGFNVQGQWKLSGVNPAMRLNKYQTNQHFSPHKDAQYAPSGDERSLFSLIIYLNDNYEHGQTKFYFPKQTPTSDTKGLTIQEEINAYGGLQNGYECVTIQPKKGYAILFTHNLLHEAVAPQGIDAERFVLRSDVLVKREEKELGFAVCAEEEEDYFACLNFFREAQQRELDKSMDSGELYERSLSIRYCYPRLLQSKMKQTIVEEEEEVLIDRLPSEIWLHIFGYVHEQDIRNFVFAYPQFQLLKIFWEAKEKQHLKSDPYQPKFIPTIHVQYGSRTLFRFSDADFFYQHVNACCRVAAVYAFFLLGHSKDSQTYTVRYDRNTQQTCEVNMEQLLADTFYNRNCYGSLYRVKQKDENKREPMIDLDHSVDRTYMTNRHQSQFIGQDLLPNLHLILENHQLSELDGHNRGKYEDHFNEQEFLAWQRRHALYDRNEKLVDEYLNANTHLTYRAQCSKDSVLGFREHVFNQIENKSGTSLFRMLSAKDHVIYGFCDCPGCYYQIYTVQDLITIYNHLIFDFDTHRLAIEHLADESSCEDFNSLLYDCVQILQDKVPQENPVSFYRVNIEKLAEVTQGFNHAGCQCQYPTVKVNQFSFLDYTYLSHVHLSVAQNNEHVYVLATYGGIAVL